MAAGWRLTIRPGSGAGRPGPPSITPGPPAPGEPRRRAAAMEIAVAVWPAAGAVVSSQEADEGAHPPR